MRDSINWTLSLGRWHGVPVRLHASCLVGVVLAMFVAMHSPGQDHAFYYGLLAVAVFFGSLLIHELGHLVAAARLGGHVDRIVIGPLGGMSPISVPHEPRREMIVALGGPIAHFLVLLILIPALLVSREDVAGLLLSPLEPRNLIGGGPWMALLKLCFWSNGLLMLVNLLPAFPLDLGRAIWSGLRAVRDERQATLMVARWGMLATILGLTLWSIPSWSDNAAVLIPAWVPLTLLSGYLFFVGRLETARSDDEDRDGDLLGYDFSQGYTSLERAGDPASKRRPGFIQRWLEQRRERKRLLVRQVEEEEERRVDEVLARLKDVGLTSLTNEEQALLHRVSERYRNRQSH